MEEEYKKNKARYQEIQELSLAHLDDEAVLEVLAERKHLEKVIWEYEEETKKEQENLQKQKALVEEEKRVEKLITNLNDEIRPDKNDDELLRLVSERHKLEDQLIRIKKELGEPLPVPIKENIPQKEKKVSISAPIDELQEKKEEKIVIATTNDREEKMTFKEAGFGEEEIRLDGLQESGDMEKYIHQLEASRESLGGFLQSLPREARINKRFMLRVAHIDPAYAMHYAADDLRHDEGFHIEIAGMKNMRQSGNALAEMDPEMRTGQVVLAGTRQDFRNVHFVREEMPEYDEIIAAAKKGALEKIKDFKEAIDVDVFIPKILQRDEDFLSQVKKIVENKKT